MSTQNNQLFINKTRVILDVILQTEPRTLRAAVACEALTYWGDDPREMFEDLAYHGCKSGMINNLSFVPLGHSICGPVLSWVSLTNSQNLEHSCPEAQESFPLNRHRRLGVSLTGCPDPQEICYGPIRFGG